VEMIGRVNEWVTREGSVERERERGGRKGFGWGKQSCDPESQVF